MFSVRNEDCKLVMDDIPDESVDLVIADPPYGARRTSCWGMGTTTWDNGKWNRFEEIEGNKSVDGEWLASAHRILKDGGAIYVFTCWNTMQEWVNAMSMFNVRNCIIWDKLIHGLGDTATCWAPQYEMILFASKGRHLLKGNRPKDVIRESRVNPKDMVHPYEKPENLFYHLLNASSAEGDLVFDPFCGVAPVGVASIKSGRNYIGCDVDANYCKIAERRLSNISDQATLF